MRKPNDLDNLEQCLNIQPNRVRVFCVECDQWRDIRMIASAVMYVSAGGIRRIDFDEDTVRFICGTCNTNVDSIIGDKQLDLYRKVRQWVL